jgi:hypothetical protein
MYIFLDEKFAVTLDGKCDNFTVKDQASFSSWLRMKEGLSETRATQSEV